MYFVPETRFFRSLQVKPKISFWEFINGIGFRQSKHMLLEWSTANYFENWWSLLQLLTIVRSFHWELVGIYSIFHLIPSVLPVIIYMSSSTIYIRVNGLLQVATASSADGIGSSLLMSWWPSCYNCTAKLGPTAYFCILSVIFKA